MTDSDGSPRLTLDRLKGLSDGVVAIVLTLMVLGIDVPTDHSFSEQGWFSFLHEMRYDILIYLVSFWLVGTYWIVHHAMFHYIAYGNRILFWLNLIFLFGLTLVPFGTKLKTAYKHEPNVAMIFGVINALCFLALAAVWKYAMSKPGLRQPHASAAIVRTLQRRILAGPVLCAGAVVVSYFSVPVGSLLFLCAPLLYVSQRRVDASWE